MNAYLQNVSQLLANVDRPEGTRLAAYNTGFGLVIALDVGPEAMTFTLGRIARIPAPPKGPTWEADWESAKRLAQDFVRSHNAGTP